MNPIHFGGQMSRSWANVGWVGILQCTLCIAILQHRSWYTDKIWYITTKVYNTELQIKRNFKSFASFDGKNSVKFVGEWMNNVDTVLSHWFVYKPIYYLLFIYILFKWWGSFNINTQTSHEHRIIEPTSILRWWLINQLTRVPNWLGTQFGLLRRWQVNLIWGLVWPLGGFSIWTLQADTYAQIHHFSVFAFS